MLRFTVFCLPKALIDFQVFEVIETFKNPSSLCLKLGNIWHLIWASVIGAWNTSSNPTLWRLSLISTVIISLVQATISGFQLIFLCDVSLISISCLILPHLIDLEMILLTHDFSSSTILKIFPSSYFCVMFLHVWQPSEIGMFKSSTIRSKSSYSILSPFLSVIQIEFRTILYASQPFWAVVTSKLFLRNIVLIM